MENTGVNLKLELLKKLLNILIFNDASGHNKAFDIVLLLSNSIILFRNIGCPPLWLKNDSAINLDVVENLVWNIGICALVEVPIAIAWDNALGILLQCIRHVHELQNLYFSLTGEELIVKELVI